MLRIGLLVILVGHALMHALGAVQSWTAFQTDWAVQNPWVFSAGVTLRSTGGKLLSLVWLAALVALLAGVYGFSTDRAWFRAVLPMGAALSVLAVTPWTNTIPESQHFMILSIDLLILVVLLFRWQIRF